MRRINVDYHHEDDSWWAESDDVAGFTAVANSFDELRRLTVKGLGFYLAGEHYTAVEHINGAPLVTNPVPTVSVSQRVDAFLPTGLIAILPRPDYLPVAP